MEIDSTDIDRLIVAIITASLLSRDTRSAVGGATAGALYRSVEETLREKKVIGAEHR